MEKHIYPFINQYSTLYLRYIDEIFMIWKTHYPFINQYSTLYLRYIDDIFMIWKTHYPFINQYFTLYLRYIDDIFMIWKGTKEQLDNFNKDLNEKHPTIKFEFEISQKQVNFLDTTVYIAANKEIRRNYTQKKRICITTYIENPSTQKS